MYERLKRLYEEGRLDEKGIWAAVDKGWITEEQAIEITRANDEAPEADSIEEG